MKLSWRAKRQLVYFGIFSAIIFVIIGIFIFVFREGPTCHDNIKNQNEADVDCGEVCGVPCLGNVKDIIVLWTRFLEISPSHYDVAVLIENPNFIAGSRLVRYRIKMHDANNILIALRSGMTSLNPQERAIILESNIDTASRKPIEVAIEFEPIQWERGDTKKADVSSFGYNFTASPSGRFEMTVRNNDIFPIENLEASVALLDETGNAFAVSRTFIEKIDGEAQKLVGFTWPRSFDKEPSSIQVYIRQIPQ